MEFKRKISLYFLVGFTSLHLYGQEAQFSQFYSASLFLNPAFAGATNGMSISVNYRAQPLTSNVSNELQQVSFQMPIYKGSASDSRLGGVGLTLFNQVMGAGRAFKTQGAMLALSKTISFDLFGPEFLTVGIQGGMTRRTIDFSNLQWPSQFNPFEPGGFDGSLSNPAAQFEDNINRPVINAGVMYQFNPEKDYLLYSISFFSGVAVTNINRPNTSFTTDQEAKQPMLIKYHGGFEYVINGKFRVSPNLLFAFQNGSIQSNFGGYLNYDLKGEKVQSFEDNLQIVGGLWYRLRDSFIFLVGVSKQKYRIGISYDLNKTFIGPSERNDTLQPAFELSLNYTFKSRQGSGRFSNPLF